MVSRRTMLAGFAGLSVAGCATFGRSGESRDSTPVVEVFDNAVRALIDPGANYVTLGVGYQWSEGPTWDRVRQTLYFTDVPQNKAYQWRHGSSVEVFLDPSGAAEVDGFREPGANGLWYTRDGALLICNHGRRAVERMDLETGASTVLARSFRGRLFNSPNDVVQAQDGTLFFTDPPYGLEGMNASPLKEQDANGVYRLDTDGTVTRLVSDMTFPNGIALSPDERTLYVSQSDPDAPVVRAFLLNATHDVVSDLTLFDASAHMAPDAPGLPDGMAVCAQGYLFVTGPGGVFILAPDGRALGRIRTGRATANCAFGEDGQSLFITSGDRLLKLRTRVLGVQWI